MELSQDKSYTACNNMSKFRSKLGPKVGCKQSPTLKWNLERQKSNLRKGQGLAYGRGDFKKQVSTLFAVSWLPCTGGVQDLITVSHSWFWRGNCTLEIHKRPWQTERGRGHRKPNTWWESNRNNRERGTREKKKVLWREGGEEHASGAVQSEVGEPGHEWTEERGGVFPPWT